MNNRKVEEQSNDAHGEIISLGCATTERYGNKHKKEITVSSENLLEEVKLPEGVKVIIAS